MTGSSARKQRREEARVMRAAGVAEVARRVIQPEHAGNIDVIVFEVGRALHDLRRKGGDMSSRLAVTVGGDHPQYPGVVVVEAKASAVLTKHAPADDCPGCPIDHSL